MADEQTGQDPYANREAITDRVKKRYDDWSRGRENFTFAAYRNIHFYVGRQWIQLDRTSLTGWRPARPPGMPTPVTNRFARVMDAHISMLARFEPSLTFAPGSHDAEDRAAADVASRATEVIQDEVDISTHRQALAKWVGLTGGAWRETGYDPDMIHGTVNLPMDVCPQCQAQSVPQPMVPMAQGAPQVDPMGNAPDAMGGPLCETCQVPMAEQMVAMPKGKLYVDVCSLFEMYFDPSVTEWSKQKAYLRQKAVDIEDAKARWKDFIDPESIRADSMGSGGTQFMEALPTLGPNVNEAPRQNVTAARASNTKTTENYYYELPSATYPDGLLAVFLGKKPETFVKAGPLPYAYEGEDGSKTPFLPHVFFPQNEVPGSAWPKTVANDLAPKQVQRNKWEAMIEKWGMRMANHVWLLAQGSNVRNLTGEFGQVVEWAAALGPHAKPERLAGNAVTPGLVEMMARIDHEMDELAIVSEVMSGNRPAGVSAGIALQILKERGETQFGPMFVKWNHAEAQWARQALAIARQYWTEERLRKIKGRDGQWEVQKFLGSDLRSTTDVKAEAGVTMPRSTMTDRAEAEQLLSAGIVNAADPEVQDAMLELFGKKALFKPGLEQETRNAIIENEQFEALAQDPRLQGIDVAALQAQVQQAQMAMMPAPQIYASAARLLATVGIELPEFRQSIDDHAAQGKEHRHFAREQRFRQLPKLIQFLVGLHTAAHDFAQGQMMQAMQAAQPGAPQQHGFLQRPGPHPGSPPSTHPMQGASSPQAMEGQHREMEQRAGHPVG